MNKIIRTLLVVCLCMTSNALFSQEEDTVSTRVDSPQDRVELSGAATVTNRGISLIPNLTLGKPAVIFDFFVGKNRLSFEPQLRFDLTNARPWSFLFWGRYRIVESKKFVLRTGIHPAYSFKMRTVADNGVEKQIPSVDRYLAGELYPRFALAKNIMIGPYMLYSLGLDKEMIKRTYYISLMGNWNNISIGNRLVAGVSPQAYYLNMDKKGGFYGTVVVSLSVEDFPVSASALFNKKIKSGIPGGKDFLWNASLTYAF